MGRGAAAARLGLIAIFVAFTTVPLLAMLRYASAHDLTFAGGESAFPRDQYQYMAWIREYAGHLLASNTLDIAPSSHVFFHPMFFVSGIGVKLGMSTALAYLLWKPVATVALFVGFERYVRRFIEGDWQRLAALTVALFFSVSALPTRFSIGGGDFFNVTSELLSSMHLWGYFPRAIAVALLPLFLLGIERLAHSQPARRRDVALVAAAGALLAWFHPWEGQVALVTAGAGIALDRAARRRRVLAIPLAAVLAPLLYYFALSRLDPSWEFAQSITRLGGDVPLWIAIVALLPLALPAALTLLRPRPPGLGERMLLLWPAAALLVFAFLSPSFPRHALEGASLPLAILAVRGLSVVRHRTAVIAAFVAVVTIPGAVYVARANRDTIHESSQIHYLQRDESNALAWLREHGEPGGVLTTADLGALVPATTGRHSWLAHSSWTRDYVERNRQAEELFGGHMPPAQAAALLRSSGARYVLVGCARATTATPVIEPLAAARKRFGCATVYSIPSRSSSASSLRHPRLTRIDRSR
jgi:hypothetical protein